MSIGLGANGLERCTSVYHDRPGLERPTWASNSGSATQRTRDGRVGSNISLEVSFAWKRNNLGNREVFVGGPCPQKGKEMDSRNVEASRKPTVDIDKVFSREDIDDAP